MAIPCPGGHADVGRIRLTVQVPEHSTRASEGDTPSSRRAGHARRGENPQKGCVGGGGEGAAKPAGFWSSDPERVSWEQESGGKRVSATDMHQGLRGL